MNTVFFGRKAVIGLVLLIGVLAGISIAQGADAQVANCTATTPPWITMISPNGGEILYRGKRVWFKWQSCNLPKTTLVNIRLIGAYDDAQLTLPGIRNTGSAILYIPNGVGHDISPGNGYSARTFYAYIQPANMETVGMSPTSLDDLWDRSDTTFGLYEKNASMWSNGPIAFTDLYPAEPLETNGMDVTGLHLVGMVISQSSNVSYWFEYGTDTNLNYGLRTPTRTLTNASYEEFPDEPITNLTPNTQYFYRLVMESGGTRYIGATSFFNTTLNAGCADLIDNDRDGLLDMADPGCTDATDRTEFNV